MKKYILLLALSGVCVFGHAQTSSEELTGAQVLRTARSIYDQGRLHELPGILETAVKRKGKNQFSQSEKIEAYKLLILTYIYLEEPQKADEKMIALLKTDRFFELTESDPVEFRNLYKKFRSNSLFRIGGKGGLGQVSQDVLGNYFVFAQSEGKGRHIPVASLQLTAFFEKDLKGKMKNFIAAPEVMMSNQTWTYKSGDLYFNDLDNENPFGGADAALTHTISQTRFQLNALLQYRFIGKAKANVNTANLTFYPYLSIGPAISYLSKSTLQAVVNMDSKDVLTSEPIDNSDRFKPISVFAIASAGIRYKLGGVYVHGDVRYQYSFTNMISENRYKQATKQESDMVWLYGYTPNDISINQFMINLGFSVPIFSPKKLIK